MAAVPPPRVPRTAPGKTIPSSALRAIQQLAANGTSGIRRPIKVEDFRYQIGQIDPNVRVTSDGNMRVVDRMKIEDITDEDDQTDSKDQSNAKDTTISSSLTDTRSPKEDVTNSGADNKHQNVITAEMTSVPPVSGISSVGVSPAGVSPTVPRSKPTVTKLSSQSTHVVPPHIVAAMQQKMDGKTEEKPSALPIASTVVPSGVVTTPNGGTVTTPNRSIVRASHPPSSPPVINTGSSASMTGSHVNGASGASGASAPISDPFRPRDPSSIPIMTPKEGLKSRGDAKDVDDEDDDDDEENEGPETLCIESESYSASGLHAPYHLGASIAANRCNIKSEYIYVCSGGAPAGLNRIFRWSERPEYGLTCERLLSLFPQGKYQKAPDSWAWFTNCCNRRCRRQPVGATPPGGDGQGSDRGADLVRDRAILLLHEYLEREGPDAYKKCNGRLYITVTRLSRRLGLPCETVYINEWTSNKDLIECVKCSSTIPGRIGPYCWGQYWRGQYWMDGGVYVIHPIRNKATVCISTSPFDIRPDQPANREKGFQGGQPSSAPLGEIARQYDCGSDECLDLDFYRQMYENGFKDAQMYYQFRRHYASRGLKPNFEFNPTLEQRREGPRLTPPQRSARSMHHDLKHQVLTRDPFDNKRDPSAAVFSAPQSGPFSGPRYRGPAKSATGPSSKPLHHHPMPPGGVTMTVPATSVPTTDNNSSSPPRTSTTNTTPTH